MEQENEEVWVYVFNGADPSERGHSGFASGVFSSREKTEAWIDQHKLSGVLTAYPLDEGAYDWGVANGFFKAKRDDQRTHKFIGRFAGGSTTGTTRTSWMSKDALTTHSLRYTALASNARRSNGRVTI